MHDKCAEVFHFRKIQEKFRKIVEKSEKIGKIQKNSEKFRKIRKKSEKIQKQTGIFGKIVKMDKRAGW